MPAQLPVTRTLRPRNTARGQHEISHRNPKPKLPKTQQPLSMAIIKASKDSESQPEEKLKRKTIRKFTYFRELPIELRFRIYRYSSLYERIIRGDWSMKPLSLAYSSVYTLSAGPVPTVLRVNREARNEALKYYKQTQKYITMGGTSWYREKKIWISMQDVIYFTAILPKHNFCSILRIINKTHALTQLAFGVQHMGKFFSEKHKEVPNLFREIVRALPNIKKFTVVFDSSQFKDSEVIAKYRFRPVTSHTVYKQKHLPFGGIMGLPAAQPIWEKDIKDVYHNQVWDDEAIEEWTKEADKKAWRVFLEKNPEWVVPELECVKILKQR